MKIICTICSRRKKEDSDLLPARERYSGDHIKLVKDIARKSKLPLYFLSGRYGLISGNTMIPYYDYYLEDAVVNTLTKLVVDQIKENKISEIEFYAEDKPSWAPYKNVITFDVAEADITLHDHTISG